MRTEYVFAVATYVTSDHPRSFKTKRADIVLFSEGNGLLDQAAVSVEGGLEESSEQIAREELYKVLLSQIGDSARVVAGPVEVREKPETETERAGARVGSTQVSADVILVREYQDDLPGKVNIDPDSDSPAIYQYHHGATQSDPVNQFKEGYKVIEYFSGASNNRSSGRQRVIGNLGETWEFRMRRSTSSAPAQEQR